MTNVPLYIREMLLFSCLGNFPGLHRELLAE